MNGQLEQMQTATRVAEQGAYVACENARIARSTLIEIRSGGVDSHNLSVGSLGQAAAVTRAEAAQIKMSQVPDPSSITNGQPINIGIVVQNIGKSAAHKMHLQLQIIRMETGKEPDFRYPISPMNEFWIGSIFPNDSFPYQVTMATKDHRSVPISDPEYKLFISKKIYFSVYARLTYVDIFGINHWIHFCGRYGHDPRTQYSVRYPKCAAYNNTDDIPIPKGASSAVTVANDLPPEITCKPPKED